MNALFSAYKERILLRSYFKTLRQYNDVNKEYQYLRNLPADILERMILCAFNSQGYKANPPTKSDEEHNIKAHVKIKNRSYPLFIYHSQKDLDQSEIESYLQACHKLQKRGLFIYIGNDPNSLNLLKQNADLLELLTGQLLQDLLIAAPSKTSDQKRHIRYAAFSLAGAATLTASLYASSAIYFLLNKWAISLPALRPWTIFEYISYTQSPYGENLLMSFAAPLVLIGGLTALYFFKPNIGSSRWATLVDLKKSKLLDKKGIVLGKYKNHYLRNDDQTHCFTFAPTGSGKGVGIVIPNLLEWPDSILCLDVKAENHELTSGYRASLGHKIINFTPYSNFKTSHCYNPFDYISSDPHMRITDLQLIATILVTCAERADPHFPEEAQDLFIGLALYILDHPEYPNTIGSVFRLLGTDLDFKELLPHIAQTFPNLHESAKQLFNSFAHKAEKERSGIKSTLGRALKLWRNPVIDAVTSKSDFSFHDLRRRRHTVYFGVGVNHIDALSPLIRVFFEQAINVMTAHEPNPVTEPRKVLMVLDEIHILGRMNVMSKIFTLLRSYNVRILGIIQGINALETIYKKEECSTIISNCAHRIFFENQCDQTLTYVSKQCGEKRIQSKTINRDGARRKISTTDKWVPLIKNHEVAQMGEQKEIILVEGRYPVKCNKINYRFDKNYIARTRFEPVATPKIEISDHTAPKYDIPKPESSEEPPARKKKKKKVIAQNKNTSPQEIEDKQTKEIEDDDFSTFY